MKESHFTSSKIPALQWGINNEPVAHKAYTERVQQRHKEFWHQPTDLFVNPDFPPLGTSPDGLISCKCCGKGLLQNRCPYKYGEWDSATVVDPKSQMIVRALHPSQKHDYYLQVQGQLAICNKDCSNFICRTPQGMHVERINRELEAIDAIRPSLDAFFKDVLLPRLLRGPFSNQKNTTSNVSEDAAPNFTQTKYYCWNQQEQYRRMVACDNPDCDREWFHFECVGLTRKPREKWYSCDLRKSN